jgi:hypothetical protein
MSSHIRGQGSMIKFETQSHDFGLVKEVNGPVTYRYRFTNTGVKPIRVNDVRAGCGCTKVNWTQDLIPPTGEGFVEATYDVNNRPGKFNKTIQVLSDVCGTNVDLVFTGDVIPGIRTVRDSFPFQTGNVRYKTNTVRFIKQNVGTTDTALSFLLINTGDIAITITGFDDKGHGYISVRDKDLPLLLPPHKPVELSVHYNPSNVNRFGLVNNMVSIMTNDSILPEKKFSVCADIHQSFPNYTEGERLTMPIIYFADTLHDFGEIKPGDIVSTDFKFKNIGKKNLVITNIGTSCGCTGTKIENTILKPGESSFVKIEFDSTGKKGKQDKFVTVYSNDPLHPEYTLKITSHVAEN